MLLYNPDKKDRQELIDEFVVRTETFNQIFADLESGSMARPEQHYLLLGQRGSGKTTLLTRLKYAVEDSTTLNKWLIPLAFSEEQYNISELSDVWQSIAAQLEDYHGFSGLTNAMELHSSKPDFESIALDILTKELDRQGRKMVLFIDNIGDLLAKFDEQEVRRLREILQTRPHIRLIAGSAVILESILDYQQPLFEFFKVIRLKGLTNEECRALLHKLAALHGETAKIDAIMSEAPARVETLRTLSGGVPRTMVQLFQVFMDNEHGNAVSDLEKILDAVTPLYKHRMDDLPTQQQKIVDAVAKNWDPISVKELRERMRLDSKVISAQLRQLEKNMVIQKQPTNTKNHRYLLRERFFNIWYLMRYGRKYDRQRVIWLVKFLEIWCNREEMESRIDKYIQQAQQGELSKRILDFYGEVYSFITDVRPETKLHLKGATPQYISSEIKLTDNEFVELVEKYLDSKSWKLLIETLTSVDEYTDSQKQYVYQLMQPIRGSVDFIKEFRTCFTEIVQKGPKTQLPYFYFGWLIYTSVVQVMMYFSQDQDPSQSVLSTTKLYKGFIGLGRASLQDHINFLTSVYELLIEGYYNLVISILEEGLPLIDMELSFEAFLYTAKYLSKSSDEDILDQLNPELRGVVRQLIDSITQSQIQRRSSADSLPNANE